MIEHSGEQHRIAADVTNNTAIPAAWLDSFEAALVQLSAIPDLPEHLVADIRRYVLNGEVVNVLDDVAAFPAIAQAWHLAGDYREEDGFDQQFYLAFEDVPRAVGLRWALLLQATMRTISSNYFNLVFGADIRWPEILLMHASGRSLTTMLSGSEYPRPLHISAGVIEGLLLEAGLPPVSLLQASFIIPADKYFLLWQRLMLILQLPDYQDYLEIHIDAVHPWLADTKLEQRDWCLRMLGWANAASLGKLAPEITQMAAGSSKQLRSMAEPLLRRGGVPIIDNLQVLATKGSAEQRGFALQHLWMLARHGEDHSLRNWAREMASADKSSAVQNLVKGWEWEIEKNTVQPDFNYAVPELRWQLQLTPALDCALDVLWQEANQQLEKVNLRDQQIDEQHVARGHHSTWQRLPLLNEQDRQLLNDYLLSDARVPQTKLTSEARHWRDSLEQFARTPGVSAMALLKTMVFFLEPTSPTQYGYNFLMCEVFNAMREQQGSPDLLELGLMLEQASFSPYWLVYLCCVDICPLGADWPAEATWSFFSHYEDAVISHLREIKVRDYSYQPARLYEILTGHPAKSEKLLDVLFEQALGNAKFERNAARQALAALPDKESRIIVALADGKAETRAAAAQWLGQLRHAPALAALETAVRKEKNDAARAAMLDCLQRLGQPADRYLDKAMLLKEAGKALTKGLHADIAWFPWQQLPAIRWASDGQVVPDEILRYLVVQAYKQKSPEPNATLRKLCEMFETSDRQELALFVLRIWLAEETRVHTPEAARLLAEKEAEKMFKTQNNSAMSKHPDQLSLTLEEYTRVYLRFYIAQPAGNANAIKGILAIAAACGDRRVVAPAAAYMKQYYGLRASQCKSLVAMLAWVEHPAAIQYVLSVSSRFRTRGIQEEATRQIAALAERKEWTLSELADRSIPDAGFDEQGLLDLSYGNRQFVGRLTDNLKIELRNEEGKVVKSLPEPRQDDDAALAKAAKHACSLARKEIKNIVTLQSERLYEALCTQRVWSLNDWLRYLHAHPVMRYVITGLIWQQVRNEEVISSLRPMTDGSFSDAADDTVILPELDSAAAEGIFLRLAHDSNLSAGEQQAWQQHFIDYQIIPPFQQLGKGYYTLPPELIRKDRISDFEGHVLDNFALRNRALKLGYNCGQSEDGGWFFHYEKRFPSLGLQASLEFTGNTLPEGYRLVALCNLSFSKITPAGSGNIPGKIALGQLPVVLLSECYNDVRLIAAEGSGFDPDWEKTYGLR